MTIRIYYTPNTWNLPRWVAKQSGYFEDEGVSVELVERNTVDTDLFDIYERKNVALFESGDVDLYSACVWGTIKRVGEMATGRIVAQRAVSENLPYSLYVSEDSDAESLADLADTPVAMKRHSGSHYATVEMLERELDPSSAVATHVGKPSRRFEALVDGGVSAATLMGPMIAVAEHLGLRRIATLSTGGAFVANEDLPPETLDAVLTALDRAVEDINENPETYRDYLAEMAKSEIKESPTLSERVNVEEIRDDIVVPRYDQFMRRPDVSELDRKLEWMKARNMFDADAGIHEIVRAR